MITKVGDEPSATATGAQIKGVSFWAPAAQKVRVGAE